MNQLMKIGDLAEAGGFPVDTLRYYDRIGLLSPARRNPLTRYREYGPEALDLLGLVKNAKAAGLSLLQIRRIVAAAREGSACREAVPLLRQRIAETDRAIHALRALRRRLAGALRGGFAGRRAPRCSCPVLDHLAPESKRS